MYLRVAHLRVLVEVAQNRAAELQASIAEMDRIPGSSTTPEQSREHTRYLAEYNTLVIALRCVGEFVDNAPIAEHVRGRDDALQE